MAYSQRMKFLLYEQISESLDSCLRAIVSSPMKQGQTCLLPTGALKGSEERLC
jgi:hypothetical protein